MSLDPGELEAIVAELGPLRGTRVRSVRVHSERALTLELAGPEALFVLLVSAEADVARLHVARLRPPAPEKPYPFQASLRRELEGAELRSLEAEPLRRLVDLGFESASGTRHLFAELSGQKGNLILTLEGGLVRGLAARDLVSDRRLAPGLPYTPPPAGMPGKTRARFNAAPEKGPFPLSFEVERHYAEFEERQALLLKRKRLAEPLRAAVARAKRALLKLDDEAARVPAAESKRRIADLLKPNLHLIRRGDRQAKVTDWTDEGPQEVTIVLDPALTPKENMERHYRHYRRIVESAAKVASRIAEVKSRLASLESLSSAVAEATQAELPKIEKEARKLGAGPRPKPKGRHKADEILPYRTFRSLLGARILVGRGALENDTLTRTVARGNDIWLHARGIPGAHVVVRTGKAEGLDQETLIDAAHLALHFSDARGVPQGDVAFTRAKYVKKPKGAAPGVVTYHQEKVLALRTEPGRIERLLTAEEEEA